MNKINKLQDELPSTTHEFQLDLLGRLTKKRYLGEFTCKYQQLETRRSLPSMKPC